VSGEPITPFGKWYSSRGGLLERGTFVDGYSVVDGYVAVDGYAMGDAYVAVDGYAAVDGYDAVDGYAVADGYVAADGYAAVDVVRKRAQLRSWKAMAASTFTCGSCPYGAELIRRGPCVLVGRS